MPALEWDAVGEKFFEAGLDRGVLYLPDGSGVPWNGLMDIVEKFDNEITPVYYDGMKIHDLVSIGSFTASLKAMTYPDKFLNFEGLAEMRPGFFAGEQPPQIFALSYRTKVGNDVDPDLGYKIHILYNVMAIPTEVPHSTIGADTSVVEFEWDIYPVPEEIPGYRPTSHFVVNTVDLDPMLLSQLEEQLYGSSTASASLLSMSDMAEFISGWYRVQIIDNGDGTWTAISPIPGVIVVNGDGTFSINQANAIFLDANTYEISDTKHIDDIT